MTLRIASLPEHGSEFAGNDESGYERLVVKEILGSATGPEGPHPQVFVVDLCDEGATLHAHFHSVDQFQLTISGSGRLGKSELRPGTLHYADAYQPYGPIVAGPQGLAYMTLRCRHDSGSHRMPGSGHLRARTPQRPHLLAETDRPGAVAGPFDDGLAAERVAVAPSSAHLLDAGGADLLAVVVEGALSAGGEEYPRWSVAHVAAGSCASVTAGHDGAALLVLRFPAPAAA